MLSRTYTQDMELDAVVNWFIKFIFYACIDWKGVESIVMQNSELILL